MYGQTKVTIIQKSLLIQVSGKQPSFQMGMEGFKTVYSSNL